MTYQITREKAREWFIYDIHTGQIYWKKNIGKKIKAGSKAGYVGKTGYQFIAIDGKRYSAHRIAWTHVMGDLEKDVVDHINGDRTDNRFINLRPASVCENSRNWHSSSRKQSSKHRGVYYAKRDKRWTARIQCNGYRKFIGSYRTEREAACAYAREAVELFGGYCHPVIAALAKETP